MTPIIVIRNPDDFTPEQLAAIKAHNIKAKAERNANAA